MAFSLTVHVIPQSRATEITLADGILRVRLREPAVDGKANEALLRLLAKTLGVPKTAITITRGIRGRNKVIFVRADSLPEPYLSGAKREDREKAGKAAGARVPTGVHRTQ